MNLHRKSLVGIAVATVCSANYSACMAAGDDAQPVGQIVVTAARGERPYSDTAQTMNVVTARMIEERAVATTPDALAGEVGVLIQKSNTGGGSPFIRGLTGKQVLILVDGVRMNNSYYRFGPHQYLNTIDPGELGRIEVVHGPSSVLYGSDALGGVINLVSKSSDYSDGAARLGGQLGLRVASADRSVAGRGQGEYASTDLSILAGVSVKRYDDLRGGKGIGLQVPTGYNEESGSLRLGYKLAPNQEIVFRQTILQQHHVPKTNEVLLGTKAKFDYEPQQNALGYLEYRARDLGMLLFDQVKLTLSHARQKEGEEIIERAAPTLETRELTGIRTLGMSVQLGKRLGESTRLTYGFEHYHDRFDTRKRRLDLAAGTETALVPGTPDGATYTSTGLYVQGELDLGDSLQLVPGLRHSEFKASGRIQSTDLKLQDSDQTASLMGVYRLTKHLNLVGGVAQGYRAPNMEDFFGRVDFVSEVPNNALVPETSLNREVGLKYQHDGLTANLQYFVSTYQDLITRVTISPGVRQRQNLRRARISGVEASTDVRFGGNWSARAALASVRGEDSDTHLPLQRIPPLTGSTQLRYAAGDSLWLAASATFAGKQDRLSPEDLTDPRIPAGGTRGYAVFDLSMGYQPLRGHELTLRLENLANKAYKTHGSGVYGPGLNLIAAYSLRI